MNVISAEPTRIGVSDRSNQLFRADKIARALGCSKQNVHQRLKDMPADAEQLTNGNLAKAWRIDSLPTTLIPDNSLRKRKRNDIARLQISCEHRLIDTSLEIRVWHEIARSGQEKVHANSAAALRPILVAKKQYRLSTHADLANRGVEAYEREFGFAISRCSLAHAFRSDDRTRWRCPGMGAPRNLPRRESPSVTRSGDRLRRRANVV